MHSLSEYMRIIYLEKITNEKKLSSLWSFYSMIKSTLTVKNQIDISKYCDLISLLKRKSNRFYVFIFILFFMWTIRHCIAGGQ